MAENSFKKPSLLRGFDKTTDCHCVSGWLPRDQQWSFLFGYKIKAQGGVKIHVHFLEILCIKCL